MDEFCSWAVKLIMHVCLNLLYLQNSIENFQFFVIFHKTQHFVNSPSFWSTIRRGFEAQQYLFYTNMKYIHEQMIFSTSLVF